jgi:hypothetical protein
MHAKIKDGRRITDMSKLQIFNNSEIAKGAKQ